MTGVPDLALCLPDRPKPEMAQVSMTDHKIVFDVSFQKASEAESKKTISYVYSELLRKLYVRQQVLCPVNFDLDTSQLPPGTVIRTVTVYSRPQDAAEPVQRCMNHIVQEKPSEVREHFVRCQNKHAEYHIDARSFKQSVTLQVDKISERPGLQRLTTYFMFMCFSSCSGTLNRRPTQLVFTLEDSQGNILGKSVIELRICACPGRDKALDENQLATGKRRNKSTTNHPRVSNDSGSSGRRESSDGDSYTEGESDEEEYHLTVKGKRAYSQIRALYQDITDARRYRKVLRQQCEHRLGLASDPIVPFDLSLNVRSRLPIDNFLRDIGLSTLSATLKGAGIRTVQDLECLTLREIELKTRLPPNLAAIIHAMLPQNRSLLSPLLASAGILNMGPYSPLFGSGLGVPDVTSTCSKI